MSLFWRSSGSGGRSTRDFGIALPTPPTVINPHPDAVEPHARRAELGALRHAEAPLAASGKVQRRRERTGPTGARPEAEGT